MREETKNLKLINELKRTPDITRAEADSLSDGMIWSQRRKQRSNRADCRQKFRLLF